ncbi:MAG: hypothetical protein GX594_17905 [Pirellulaceae bacterium]|nr:hypothetical protein [Pirellulaceae bacterium]
MEIRKPADQLPNNAENGVSPHAVNPHDDKVHVSPRANDGNEDTAHVAPHAADASDAEYVHPAFTFYVYE